MSVNWFEITHIAEVTNARVMNELINIKSLSILYYRARRGNKTCGAHPLFEEAHKQQSPYRALRHVSLRSRDAPCIVNELSGRRIGVNNCLLAGSA